MSFQNFLDKDQLIVQRLDAGGDGGDSAHRFGAYIFAKSLLDEVDTDWETDLGDYYEHGLSLYTAPDGLLRRHPDTSRWYSRTDNFSRDQTRMILAAAYAMDDTDTAERVLGNLLKRCGWHYNVRPNYVKPGQDGWKWKIPDNIIPSQITMAIRTIENPIFYPVLYILDAFLLVDLALTAYADRKDIKTDGSRTDAHTMLLCDIVSSVRTMPTFWSKLAGKIYKRMDYAGALRYIFSQRRSYDPPLAEPLIAVANRYL